MYIAKLSGSSQSFVSAMSSAGRSRSAVASLALAKVISVDLSIPSAPVDDLNDYWRMQARTSVEQLLGVINEVLLIDRPAVLELTYRFFQQRYHTVHPTKRPIYVVRDNAVASFFDISRAIPKDIIDLIQTETASISACYNGFLTLVCDMVTASSTSDTEGM